MATLKDEFIWQWFFSTVLRSGKPMNPRLRVAVGYEGNDDFWSRPEKIACISYLHTFKLRVSEHIESPSPVLDLSRCFEMEIIDVQRSQPVSSIIMPPNGNILVSMKIHLNEYTGPPTVLDECRYTRLEFIDLRLGSVYIPVDFRRFPALHEINIFRCGEVLQLDLSEHLTPICLGALDHFLGTIIPPKNPIGFMSIDYHSLKCPSVIAAISMTRSLLFRGLRMDELRILAAALSPRSVGPDVVFESAVLHELKIYNLYDAVGTNFGLFPVLRKFVMSNAEIPLRGENFPALHTLESFSCNLSMEGVFPMLHSVNLEDVKLAKNFVLNAPHLKKLSCVHMKCLNHLVVTRTLFPHLVELCLRYFTESSYACDSRYYTMPQFGSALGVIPCYGILGLDANFSPDIRAGLRRMCSGPICPVHGTSVTCG